MYTARRHWLQNVSPGDRVEQVLQTYRCFKDHIEVSLVIPLLQRQKLPVINQTANI